jgi:MoaA/NifB/PqqE/SkfB family radical SAM enzyme
MNSHQAVVDQGVLPPIDTEVQLRLRTALQKRQTAEFYYLIDVVGTCNLTCPSCPVGNYTSVSAKGLMPVDYFERVLDKAKAEHPGKKLFFDLYNWGEPALHPNLSKLIAAVKTRSFGCGISCNLNVFPDMRAVVKSQPDYIRISLSGYHNETYQQTHRKGDVNRVKANMYMLRHYIDLYKADIIVQVGYHVYRTNFPNDFLAMRRLCDELGFIFAPVIASLMPVEKAVTAVDGVVAEADKPVLDKMVLSMKEWAHSLAPYRKDHQDCQYRAVRTTINYDGSVPLCCATYEDAQIVARDFLEVPHDEIQKRKYAHEFCGTCMTRNLDMMYTAVPSPKMEAAAAEILGPVWRAYIEQANQPLERRISWKDKTYGIQEGADLAAALVRRGDKADARSIYELICSEMPEHGDAHYHLAWLVADENIERALQLLEIARKLLPGHPPYERAERDLLASRGVVRVGKRIARVQDAYNEAVERESTAPDESRELFVAIRGVFPDYNGGTAPPASASVPPVNVRSYGGRVMDRAKSIGRRLMRP